MCGLSEIPEEVQELRWLESLCLGAFWWKSTSEASGTQNQEGANTLSDLSPIAGLTQLRALHLQRTPIGSLAPLAALRRLELLDIGGTRCRTSLR
jgi:hypothetical protein